jgi:lecithin:cholesterol acyltransferase
MPNNPIIVIPGFLGSNLENYYALEPQTTWGTWKLLEAGLAGPDLRTLALDAEGKTDASLDVVTRASSLLMGPYAKLVLALRARRSAPVYVFPYDWRYSTALSGKLLASFVARVRNKMAAAQTGWRGKVDFVTHSFGGMVFRAFLASSPAPETIGQVVFITVPHRGCLDAAEAMIRGHSTLLYGRKELRKLARNLPSVYEILPTFSNAVQDEKGAELDLFALETWQDNVTAVGSAGPEQNGFDVSQARLDAARQQLADLRPATDVVAARDILTIYGSDPHTTLARVPVHAAQSYKRWFDFDNAQSGDGDGIVLATSALLPGVASIRLVQADASIFAELNARLSFHSFVCALDETQSIVSRFLDGQRGAAALLPLSLPQSRYSE